VLINIIHILICKIYKYKEMSIGIHVAKISHVMEYMKKKRVSKKKQNENEKYKMVLTRKTRKTMIDALTDDFEFLKFGTCQIFVQGPRNSNMSKMDYVGINKYCIKHDIKLFVHSSYISIGIFSVNNDTKNTSKSKNAIKIIVNQMKACDLLGSYGFVIHLSKRTPEEICETMEILIPHIKKFKTPLIFEQPAKKADGNKTYETPEKINTLNNLLIEKFPKYTNWGWCLDTCHLWSAGIQIESYKHMKEWLSELSLPKKIILFHLNGGLKKYFGTGKDTHIIPFEPDDAIWHSYKLYSLKKLQKTSIGIIINFAKKYKVPCILEINRGSQSDSIFAINTLTNLINWKNK
jgi:deoxyribonuclease-4